MNFDIPEGLQNYLSVLDDFIEAEIKPLENENDNIRFFDHRREDARTDWDRGGLPNEEWEALLAKRVGALTRRVTIVTRFLRSTAVRMAPIWAWRSSVSISLQKD